MVALAVGVVAVVALASVALAVDVLVVGVPALGVLVVAGLVLSGVVVVVDVVFLGGVWEWCAGVGGEVAGEAIEFVDDGVVDLAVLCEVGQHLLQLGAVGAAGGLAASFSGRSTTSAPIVIAAPATEAAFCSASLVTRTKLTTPAALRSISSPGVLTLIPAPLRLLQRNIITSSCQCSLVLRLGRL